jgi:hypothetical protein
MRHERLNRGLQAQRKRLQVAAVALSVYLVVLLITVGGSEFMSIVKSSFEKPVCCIDRTRNPFEPLH